MTTVGPIQASSLSAGQHGSHGAGSVNGSAGPDFATAMRSAVGRQPLAPVPSSPKHHPTPGQAGNAGMHDIQEMALKLHEYRLQLIASNIANADTPNYKAVDIDYREALRNAQGISPTRGAAGNILSVVPIKYQVSQQGNVDGNTVDMDVERAKFADSMIRYEFSVQKVSHHYKMISELLSNLRD